MRKKIIVLMLTKNSSKWMDRVITPIKEQSIKYDIQLILVDGNSTDDTISKARKYFPKLDVIYDDSKNLAHARNLALQESRKYNVDYASFIDSDIVVPKDFFDRLLGYFKNPRTGIVGLRFEFAKVEKNGFVKKFYRERKDIRRQGAYKANYTKTACSILRKNLVEDVLINEIFKRAGEDIDFNLQIREKGYEAIVCADEPAAMHLRMPSITGELVRAKDQGISRALNMKLHSNILSEEFNKTIMASILTLLGWIGLFLSPFFGFYGIVGLLPFGGMFFKQMTKFRRPYRLDFVFLGFLLNIIYCTRFLEGIVRYR